MTEINLDIAIPQKPPMRLIDRIICIEEDFARCAATITKEHLFYQSDIDGVYAWIGVEMMAQTAATYVYGTTVADNEAAKAKIAFLTSVRQFKANINYYPCGSTLTVIAHKALLEEEYAVFNCEIWQEDNIVATAKLSAYQPKSAVSAKMLGGL